MLSSLKEWRRKLKDARVTFMHEDGVGGLLTGIGCYVYRTAKGHIAVHVDVGGGAWYGVRVDDIVLIR